MAKSKWFEEEIFTNSNQHLPFDHGSFGFFVSSCYSKKDSNSIIVYLWTSKCNRQRCTSPSDQREGRDTALFASIPFDIRLWDARKKFIPKINSALNCDYADQSVTEHIKHHGRQTNYNQDKVHTANRRIYCKNGIKTPCQLSINHFIIYYHPSQKTRVKRAECQWNPLPLFFYLRYHFTSNKFPLCFSAGLNRSH